MSTPVASLASLHDAQVHDGAIAALQPAVGQTTQGRARVQVAELPAATAAAPGLARRRLRQPG